SCAGGRSLGRGRSRRGSRPPRGAGSRRTPGPGCGQLRGRGPPAVARGSGGGGTMTVIEIIAAVLIGGGLLLGVVAAVGLNRFDGVLMRIHAASKPQVLGLVMVFTGASLAARSWSLAAFLLVVLLAQMLTVPAASVMVGRAAFRRGFVRGGDYAIDELSPRLADTDDED